MIIAFFLGKYVFFVSSLCILMPTVDKGIFEGIGSTYLLGSGAPNRVLKEFTYEIFFYYNFVI